MRTEEEQHGNSSVTENSVDEINIEEIDTTEERFTTPQKFPFFVTSQPQTPVEFPQITPGIEQEQGTGKSLEPKEEEAKLQTAVVSPQITQGTEEEQGTRKKFEPRQEQIQPQTLIESPEHIQVIAKEQNTIKHFECSEEPEVIINTLAEKTITEMSSIMKGPIPTTAKVDVSKPITAQEPVIAPKLATAPIKEDAPVSTQTSTPPEENTEEPTSTHGEEPGTFDVSQHIYDGVKNIWGFGCSIGIVRPFLKVTEGAAGKILGMTTGINLANGDEEIKPKLAELDHGVINPAISKVVGVFMPVVEKGESIVRPIVMTIGPTLLGPFGLMKNPAPTITKEEAKEADVKSKPAKVKVVLEKKDEEETSTPEITPIPVPVQ